MCPLWPVAGMAVFAVFICVLVPPGLRPGPDAGRKHRGADPGCGVNRGVESSRLWASGWGVERRPGRERKEYGI